MIHSFLLIGQSNMAGRGKLNEAVEINSENVKLFINGIWRNFFRPINRDRSFSGVSLAESFAEKYAEKYGVEVGLICCADGGTCLDQWKPGGLLYDNALSQARLAMRTSTIAGVLWHQGEWDATEDHLVDTYKERFETMMNSFREELNLYDVPFLVGELGEYLKNYNLKAIPQNYARLNGEFRKIADSNPMTGLVSSAGLTPNEDNLHFNSASLYEFGHRYFDEFERLRDPNKVFEEKPREDQAIRTSMESL